MRLGVGLVMRVGAVRADRDVGRVVVARQALLLVAAHHKLLDVVLVDGLVRSNPARDLGEGLVDDAADFVRGFEVHLALCGRPDGLELLDEVGARDEVDAGEGADEFDGSGVHARDVGDVVLRRILHGDLSQHDAAALEPAGRERVAHGGVEFLPAAVDDLPAGQGVELEALDGVDDLDGLARDGDEVEPAARREALVVEPEDAVGERVAAAEVVEEPTVELRLAERRLDVRDALRVRRLRARVGEGEEDE